MENLTKLEPGNPPKLIAAITEGFNTVASKIYLILFPIILDTFLWLGPHLRIKNLVEPFITNLSKGMPDLSTPEIVDMGKWSNELWGIILNHFNLISLIRSFPIGIPSLMAGLSPIETPFGSASLFEIKNFLDVVILWGIFTAFGIVLGCLYFDAISRSTSKNGIHFSFTASLTSILQIVFFTVLCLIGFILFAIPTLLIITVLTLISSALGQIALLFIFILIIWLVMPLVFSPHGVFVDHLPIYSSISTSIRLVRYFLPGTGMFVLTSLLLYQGLNLLWETPPETSWMFLVGIFGHAFISTGLTASSFVYYRKGIAWMESKQHQAAVRL